MPDENKPCEGVEMDGGGFARAAVSADGRTQTI